MNLRRNAGFTIIELIVVIIILGILAAVALPRFMDATERAHDANVLAVKGAIAEAVSMAKAQWYVNGNSKGDAEYDIDDFGDGTTDINGCGWAVDGGTGSPIATSPSSGEITACTGALTDADDQCVRIFKTLLQSNAPSVGPAATGSAPPNTTEWTGTMGSLASGITVATSVEGSGGASVDSAAMPHTACIYTYTPDQDSARATPADGLRQIYYNTYDGQVWTNLGFAKAEEGS